MISTYLFHLTEIIHLNTFSEFLGLVYMTFKLNILLNYAEHPKRLARCYTLPLFIFLILDSFIFLFILDLFLRYIGNII